MQTRTINTYSFDELSEEAKEKAIERFYDINVHHEWWDFIYDDSKEIGKLMGITIDNIYFSGFWSQGDGACLEGSYHYEKGSTNKIREYAPKDGELHNIADRLQEIQKKHFYKLSATVKHSGMYYHEYSTDITVMKDGDYMYFKGAEQVESDIVECLRDLMRWIYKSLEKEYDYLTSKKAIIETIKANEYEFSEGGKLL